MLWVMGFLFLCFGALATLLGGGNPAIGFMITGAILIGTCEIANAIERR